jgi:diadenosine tetraphosphate (Ap4A) HIT family hydrolase
MISDIPHTCPFCDPRERVLKENALAFALLSNPRRMPGHFLVIPKRHVEKPWEITEEETRDIFELIKFIQQRIVPAIGEGCDVRQHYRPFLPQGRTKINHIHYHVMPRNFKDRLYEICESRDSELFEDLTPEEHDRIAKLLE